MPSCIFDSRIVCESILKRLHTHAAQRMSAQAQESLFTKSWSICNPDTTAALYRQLALETFRHSADTAGLGLWRWGWATLIPPSPHDPQ